MLSLLPVPEAAMCRVLLAGDTDSNRVAKLRRGRAGGGVPGPSPRTRGILCAARGRDLVIRFDRPSISAVRSAMLPPTELKRKVLPGYSFSSTYKPLTDFTLPSTVSTGALKWR